MKKISKFLKKINNIIDSSGINLEKYEVYYRGESKKYEKTIPSIFRGNYLENEHNIFRELELRYPNIFDNAKTTIDKLAIMQHYGLPTRLLDFTTNPLLALYMAIDTSSFDSSEPIIKIVFVKKEKIKYYDSDTVSVFSNFSKVKNQLKVDYKGYYNDNGKIGYFKTPRQIGKAGFKYLDWTNFQELDIKNKYVLGQKICKDNGDLQYLLHEIKGEKPYFKDMIWLEHLDKSVIFVKPKHNSQRIINQAGIFALFGLNEGKKEDFSLEDCESINDFKITSFLLFDIVNKKRKKSNENIIEKIKKSLSILGVSNDKVYPEIENASKYISKIYK